MPWTMKVVFLLRRMLMRSPLARVKIAADSNNRKSPRRFSRGLALDLGDGATGRLPHRDRAVAVLDPVAIEDLEDLVLPGAGDAEDRDRLARVLAQLEAGLDRAAGDAVDAGGGGGRHDHGDALE